MKVRCIGLATMLLPLCALASTLTVPSGTKVYAKLEQEVTSNHKTTRVGDLVHARAWRSVVVDGHTVIEAGAPMVLRVSEVQKRRIAGRKGSISLQAVSVRAADGTEVYLDGGYNAEGKKRMGLAASLGALVVWPAIFIKGKDAVLPPGTVVETVLSSDTRLAAASTAPVIRLAGRSPLLVEILYDEIPDDGSLKDLPLKVTLCEARLAEPVQITTVNERGIEALPVELSASQTEGGCDTARGAVRLKSLSDHLMPGINRFTVSANGLSSEVIMDVEV